ncbi:hypothetical protein [Stenomitos frigidus]|nr:hypothetical protein [Stenomitos frigidus]
MVPVLADQVFILQQVVQLLLAQAEAPHDSNLVLQLALTELVKQVMRSFAQTTAVEALQGHLLHQAVQTTHQLLQAQVGTTGLPCDLAPYFERIYRSQHEVAQAMTELSWRLVQTESEVFRARTIVDTAPVPFGVTPLGIHAIPEGLLAEPLQPCGLQREVLQRDYAVRGLHFPWEVTVQGLTCIVESDGSLITFLEGLSPAQVLQAGTSFELLARDLYVPLVVAP